MVNGWVQKTRDITVGEDSHFGKERETKQNSEDSVLVLLILWNCHCLMFHELS